MPSLYQFPEPIWLGTNTSLDAARHAYDSFMAGQIKAGEIKAFGNDNDEETEKPFNYQVQGDIGVVTISGSLTNKDAWYNRYFGITSYNDIRKSLDFAARDGSAKEILLYVDSGGGSVAGVADTAEMIKTIDAKIKPVYAFTDGTMASAAYWLGSSARKVYNSDTAMVGSIGVIMTHMEYSKQLKDAGVGVNVLRAGEFKALLNSVEPATKVALEQAGEMLQAAYGVFLDAVATNRNVSTKVADDKMAQGREFFGAKAVEAGLTDGVTTLDKLVSKMQARLDKATSTTSNPGHSFQPGNTPMKRALTEQDIAAIQSGAQLEGAVEQGTDPKAGDPAPAATEEQTKPAADVTESQEKKDDGVLAFVQGQLAAANTQVVDLKVQLAAATAQLEAMKASQTGLLEIAAGSLRTINVALGRPAETSGMDASAIIAAHTAASAVFKEKFKVGGVAAASDKETADKGEALPKWARNVKATQSK